MRTATDQKRIDDLRRRLDRALSIDRPRLAGRLRSAAGRVRRGEPADRMLDQIEARLNESIAAVEQRRASWPHIEYPADLPVAQKRDQIMAAIAEHAVTVVCGATGSGKTTQLPKMCLELGRGVAGMIGHTQPRRLAARAVATRIAEELNTPLGKQVGYKMRFADHTDAATLIKVMTDGILLAELSSDKSLAPYDTLIIDEAHERSLNIDFLLGYLKQLMQRRADLKLIITSATIDPQRFADHFGGAPIINVEGRTYPVAVRYRPLRTPGDQENLDTIDGIREAMYELAGEDHGDVLVFLPGERDIREAAEALSRDPNINADVLPLYARLPNAAQQRIFHPTGGRRVILATNVAETSLTVPRIRHVIDSGEARISRYSSRSKVQRLPIEAISKASADQRKGRCGRLAPGICIRLYAEDDFEQRPEFTEPEVQRTNLASVILQMSALKLGDPRTFDFLDPPSGRMISDGYDTLFELGAIDEEGRLTRIGRDLSRLPVDPRIGRMILAGRDENCLREVLVIASALSIQDPRVRPPDRRQAADEAHGQWFTGESDLLGYLNLWQWFRKLRSDVSRNRLRRALDQNFLSYPRMREWEDLHKQLRDSAADLRLHLADGKAEPDAIHRAMLTGLLVNVGYREEGHEYTGAHGRKFFIFPGSSLFVGKPKWITAAELIETSKLYAHGVAPIQPNWIEQVAPHLVKKHHTNPRWDIESQRVVADERATLFGLTIVPRRVVHLGPIDAVTARNLFIHHGLVEGELRTGAGFHQHNLHLIEQIERLEAKQRKRDILVDAQVRFDFYDARLPADVYSKATLEKWLKAAGPDADRELRMTRELLLAGRTDHITEALYPDQLEAAGAKLKLDYVAEPGHEADGVTATVPLGLLSQVSEDQVEWLVPGLLRDKVEAMLRALPKRYRRQFVPIPDFVDRLVPRLKDFRGQGRPLVEAMRACIAAHMNVDVPTEAWQTEELEEHLRMNIAVTDENEQVIATGRDLAALRSQLGDTTREAIREAHSVDWQRDGIAAWDFGEIPETVTLQSRGMTMHGYPAVVDQGEAVGLRVFDTSDEAAAETRRGIRRLFALQAAGELSFIARELRGLDAMAMKMASVCDKATLVADVLDAAVDVTFIEGQPAVRDGEAFDRRLVDRGAQLQPTAERVWATVARAIQAYHEAVLAMDELGKSAGDVRADVTEQLKHLMPAHWVRDTPWGWLAQVPRYLQAVGKRVDKVRDGRAKQDAERLAELLPYWRAWADGPDVSPRPTNEALMRYRWMLEEFRVSLFAQELGTAMKVSPKRMCEQASKAGLAIKG